MLSGNSVCEVGESSCSDCGPFDLSSGFCSSGCYPLTFFMFDVEAIEDVLISSITVEISQGNGGKNCLVHSYYQRIIPANIFISDVTLYTAAGSYSDKFSTSSSWTQIFSSSYTSSASK
jgi:hypothetical protein